MRRFLPSLWLVLVILVTAPFIGMLRKVAFDAFPVGAVATLAVILGLIVLGVFVYGFVQIRERRPLRYGLFALAGLLLWFQAHGFSASDATVGLVEAAHIVLYGMLSILLYRALLPKDADGTAGTADPSTLLLPLLGVTFAGTLDEWVQLFAAMRLGDASDIVLNAYSGLCGLLIALGLEPPRGWRWRIERPLHVTDALAATVLIVGLFYNHAHLGYLIEDPRLGRFRSWHSPEALQQAKEERLERWAESPPKRFRPWQVEDRYLTEAGWHKSHRDRNRELGYLYWAWQSNLILEIYYHPYLDLEGFLGQPKRRYSAKLLEEIAAGSPIIDPDHFTSPVLRHRIKIWPPKPQFLMTLGVTALLIAGVPRLMRRRRRHRP